MIRSTVVAILSVIALSVTQSMTYANAPSAIAPLLRTVDLNIGQEVNVALSDGTTAKLKLVDLEEIRDEKKTDHSDKRVLVHPGIESPHHEMHRCTGGVEKNQRCKPETDVDGQSCNQQYN